MRIRIQEFYNFVKTGIILVLFLSAAVGSGYAANVSPLPYGINVHQVGNNVLNKVREAGIEWIRTGASWFAVEPVKGTFDWTQCDRVVDYADANGLSVLFLIAYTPGWANGNKGINYPSDNVGDWENFVRLTVNRYKNKVKYWNIWNEPNSADFFVGGKESFVDRVFLPAARAIRAEDPSAFIVGPELAHLTSLDEEWYFWMKYILVQCYDYIDVVSHHIYKNEGVYYIYELLETGETLIPSVQEIIEETGHQSKPFWITETGWNTRTFSESVQADRYLEMLRQRRSKNYPHKIFFYEIIDDPSPGIDPWGILRSDLSEKSAYNVYKDFIDGRYPDDGGDDNGTGGDEKKKCYAEQTAPGTGTAVAGNPRNSRLLANLRNARDMFKNVSFSAWKLVRFYYEMNNEFLALSLADSRVYRLGVELLYGAAGFVEKGKGKYWHKKLDRDLILKMGRLISLLKGKRLSKSFREFLTWGEGQLQLISKGTLAKYFLLHLGKEMRKLPHPGFKAPGGFYNNRLINLSFTR